MIDDLLESLRLLHGKTVTVETAGCRIQGRLRVSWSPQRLVIETKDGSVLVQGWDKILTPKT